MPISRRAFHRGALAAGGAGLSHSALAFAKPPARTEAPLKYILGSCMYGYTKLEEILPEVAKVGASAIDIWPKVHGSQREQLDEMGERRFAELLRDTSRPARLHHAVQAWPLWVAGGDEAGAAARMPHYCHGRPRATWSQGKGAEAGGWAIHLANAAPLGGGGRNRSDHRDRESRQQSDRVAGLVEMACRARAASAGRRVWRPTICPKTLKLLSGLIGQLGQRIAVFYAWQHGMGCHQKLPKEQELLQMPGRGDLDFKPLLDALSTSGFRGWTEIFMHPVPRGIPILDSTARSDRRNQPFPSLPGEAAVEQLNAGKTRHALGVYWTCLRIAATERRMSAAVVRWFMTTSRRAVRPSSCVVLSISSPPASVSSMSRRSRPARRASDSPAVGRWRKVTIDNVGLATSNCGSAANSRAANLASLRSAATCSDKPDRPTERTRVQTESTRAGLESSGPRSREIDLVPRQVLEVVAARAESLSQPAGLPHQGAADADWAIQPFVRIECQGVGAFHAAQQPAPSGRHGGKSAIGGVDVHPKTALGDIIPASSGRGVDGAGVGRACIGRHQQWRPLFAAIGLHGSSQLVDSHAELAIDADPPNGRIGESQDVSRFVQRGMALLRNVENATVGVGAGRGPRAAAKPIRFATEPPLVKMPAAEGS